MIRRFSSLFAGILVVVGLTLGTVGSAHADPRDFTIINGSAVTITHIYVGASDSDDWGDDILGRDVLDPGESVNITFSRYDGEAGNCQYDIQVTGRNGEAGYLYKVDLCSTFTVTFN